MPATRPLKSFSVKNTKGETITIQRRCFGDGKLVQKQFDGKVYNELTKKFENPQVSKDEKKVLVTDDSGAAAEVTAKEAKKLAKANEKSAARLKKQEEREAKRKSFKKDVQ